MVAIYDKSVEYISGGSNVPEIKEFFWKWRRQHYPHTENSLDRKVPEHHSAERDRHGRPGRLRGIDGRPRDTAVGWRWKAAKDKRAAPRHCAAACRRVKLSPLGGYRGAHADGERAARWRQQTNPTGMPWQGGTGR